MSYNAGVIKSYGFILIIMDYHMLYSSMKKSIRNAYKILVRKLTEKWLRHRCLNKKVTENWIELAHFR